MTITPEVDLVVAIRAAKDEADAVRVYKELTNPIHEAFEGENSSMKQAYDEACDRWDVGDDGYYGESDDSDRECEASYSEGVVVAGEEG